MVDYSILFYECHYWIYINRFILWRKMARNSANRRRRINPRFYQNNICLILLLRYLFQTLIFLLSGWCQLCCVFMLQICSKVFNRVKFWKGSLTRSIKSTGNSPPFFSLFSSQDSNAFFSRLFQRKEIMFLK